MVEHRRPHRTVRRRQRRRRLRRPVPQGRDADRGTQRTAVQPARSGGGRGAAGSASGTTTYGCSIADAAAAHVHVGNLLGATFTPHCAAVHPLRLAAAIASAAARAGAHIVEGVDVVDVEPRRLTTTAGTIRADVVVLATEAYTGQLPGRRRSLLPIYSMMIASAPLSDDQWADIGLDGPTDVHRGVARRRLRSAHRRRTPGLRRTRRAVPLRIAGRRPLRHRPAASVAPCTATVTALFPVLRDVEFPYHWGGPLAAPRDWHPHVAYDRTVRRRQRRRLRRRRCRHGEPRRAHPRRPHPRSRHGPDAAAVGRAPLPTVGAGAVAVAGCPPRRRGGEAGRSRRGVRRTARRAASDGLVQDRRNDWRTLRISGGSWGRRSSPGSGRCRSSRRRARRRVRAGDRTASSTARARECRGRTGRRPSG